MLKKVLVRLFRGHSKASLLLLALGTIAWSLTMVKSGLLYPFGMGFWGPNGHDGVWHISLAQSLAKGSWEMPVFAGFPLQNYHIGFDLLLSMLHVITRIPVQTLYFQILPPIFALIVGFFAFQFVYLWKHSRTQAFWATFFIYFGGSFGWIIQLLRFGSFDGESLFWSQQSVSTLINPPFALSLILLFSGLTILLKAFRTKNYKLLTLVTFLFGITIQVKVYAGLLILTGLLFIGLLQILRREGLTLIKVFTGVLLLSILLFSPTSSTPESTIRFQPFWFLESLFSSTDRLFWPKYAEAMSNYVSGGNWLKATAAYGIAGVIFVVGNMGTRLLGLGEVFSSIGRKKISYTFICVGTIIAAGIVVPLLFTQTGNPWNTIQFFYYSQMFAGLLAGISIGRVIDKSNLVTSIAVIALLIVFTIPTTLSTLFSHYLPSRPPARISNSELSALEFLSKQPRGVILVEPFDKEKADKAIKNPPRPLHLYESTAYVSAFSKQPVYLEEEINLEITGYPWKERREKSVAFFRGEFDNPNFLDEENISYIYVHNVKDAVTYLPYKPIFQNDEVTIYSFR